LGTKQEGVETGVKHVPPGEGRSLWVLGELVTYKIPSEQTGGAYSLFEVTTQPGGGVPPMSSTARTSPSGCSKKGTSS
jgi:hypothetical protein